MLLQTALFHQNKICHLLQKTDSKESNVIMKIFQTNRKNGDVQIKTCLFISTKIFTFGPCCMQALCNFILPSLSTISNIPSNSRHSLSRSCKALIESNVFEAHGKNWRIQSHVSKVQSRILKQEVTPKTKDLKAYLSTRPWKLGAKAMWPGQASFL